MNFLLQQGWGMMDLDNELISRKLASGVILTPRVYTPEQASRHSQEIRDLGGELLFDPGFYLPHTERERILEYPYWGNLNFDTATFDEAAISAFCNNCIQYQLNQLHVSKVIIPGRYSNALDENWLMTHRRFADAAKEIVQDIPLYSTIALGPDVILNNDVFNGLLDEITGYPVNGIYLVLRHANDSFLVEDDNYLYNLLDGLLTISLSGKDIILGYSNQQTIIFAAAGVKTIASGNFRNTRVFCPDMFDTPEETEFQRGIWYYDANTLSEYRINSLTLAFRRGLSNRFGPSCEYCQPLLDSSNPADVPWREPLPFKHYLHELQRQWLPLRTGNTPYNNVVGLLEQAHTNMQNLALAGFHVGDRSFHNYFAPCLNALSAFYADRRNDLDRL